MTDTWGFCFHRDHECSWGELQLDVDDAVRLLWWCLTQPREMC